MIADHLGKQNTLLVLGNAFRQYGIQFYVLLAISLTITMLVVSFSAYKTSYLDYPFHIRQMLHYESLLKLDFSSFVETAPLRSAISYPGWHICVFFIYKFLLLLNIPANESPVIAAALMSGIVISLTMLTICFVFMKFLKTTYRFVLAPIFAGIILFCGPLYVPFVNTNYYPGQLFVGVWHNPTTQPLKFFIIVVFFLYCHILNNRDNLEKENMLRWPIKMSKLDFYFILIALLLSVSAIFKSSMLLVYIPATFIFCCVDVIATRFKNLGFCMKSGLSVLPACLVLGAQYIILRDFSDSRVVISFMTVWNTFSPHWFLSIIISIPFPLFVLCLCGRQLFSNKMILFSLMALIISIFEFMLLVVDPYRLAGDFSWGMQLCALLIFVVSFIVFNNYIYEQGRAAFKTKVVAIIGYSILLAQFFYGVVFFISLVKGADVQGVWHL